MTPPPLRKKKVRMMGGRRSALDDARGRLVLVSGMFVLFFILVAIRVADLAIIQGYLDQNTALYETVSDTAQAVHVRADITDRNGVLLATSLETSSLYADPKNIIDPEGTAAALAKIFPDLAYGSVLQKLQRSGRFVWIKRNLTPSEQFEVLKVGDPGLGFEEEMHRIYPQGPLAAHMVGYTDLDEKGLAGVERSFNSLLSEGGAKSFALSLDIRLQHVLRREMMKALTAFEAGGAAGAILDLSNGEILAGVSLPDFDPNMVSNADPKAFFNRLTLGVYELGSTFKIFSTAALLEINNVPMDMTFDAREPIKRGRFKISDYHAEERILTLPEVFMYSSNIGSALMGEAVGTENLKKFYSDLGFMQSLDIEIGEVGKPIYPQPWREINTLTASYGHGIAVSPLQLVVAAASIVGDGTLIQPTLTLGRDATEESQNRPEVRVVSSQTAHRMRQLMRLVVTDGTGASADVPGLRVGGKTGTAEKPGAGGYDRSKLISSFLGFFPMEAPRYAVFIMVDEPKGTKETFGYATGGWVAAPAVGRVIENMAVILGIEPDDAATDFSASLKRHVSIKGKEGEGHLASY